MSTSSEFHIVSTGIVARFLATLAQVVRSILGIVRNIGNRGDVQMLLEMDERALKDIGLTRNDVLGALAQPLIKDPSKILLVRSVERRARARTLDVAVPQGRRVFAA
jgi:uncharacterized protein YjiS (DUF1127 family)